MAGTKLFPCPFCGSEDVSVEAGYWDSHGARYEVGCDNPQCAVHPYSDLYSTEAEAVAAWNTRAERTCQIDHERHCSNCGVYIRDEAVLVRKDLNDGAWTVVPKPINYCPNCGARVVSE